MNEASLAASVTVGTSSRRTSVLASPVKTAVPCQPSRPRSRVGAYCGGRAGAVPRCSIRARSMLTPGSTKAFCWRSRTVAAVGMSVPLACARTSKLLAV